MSVLKSFQILSIFAYYIYAAPSLLKSSENIPFASSILGIPMPPIPDQKVMPRQCDNTEFTNMINPDLYDVSTYTITTPDDYILTMHNIKLTQEQFEKLPEDKKANRTRPVLLVAGWTADSDLWFQAGEKNAVGFWLVQNGFDVWTGNNRGTKYSRKHKKENITPKEFFNFTWQEFALQDIPAYYRRIQKEYGNDNQKIMYFGHSEGTTDMFAALVDESTTDYLGKNTERVFMLSPSCQHASAPGWSKQKAQVEINLLYAVTKLMGVYWVGDDYCQGNMALYAIKETVHSAQTSLGGPFWKKDYIFGKFNYGPIGNLFKYGSLSIPKWDMSKYPINAKQTILHNELDEVTTQEELNLLISMIGKENVELKIMKGWHHLNNLQDEDHTQMFEVLAKDLLN